MSFVRSKPFWRSLPVRLAAWYGMTFLAGAAVVFIGVYLLLNRLIREQDQEAIETRLSQFRFHYERRGVESIRELCQLRISRTQRAFFVRLINDAKEVSFLRDPEDWEPFALQELLPNPEKGLRWDDLHDAEGLTLRVLSDRMRDGVTLQVGKTLELGDSTLRNFRLAWIGVGCLMAIMGGVGGMISARRALRPVRDLTAHARSIMATGDFQGRVALRGTGDELDELVECFNAMLERIERLVEGMRGTLDNVAHDLRTPLTRLRNTAWNAVDQNRDQAACHEALWDCLEESDRVVSLLKTLMDLAEAESGVLRMETGSVSIARLGAKVIDLYGELAEEKSLTLQADLPGDLYVAGEEIQLLRVLGNLLDNALKYTQSGGLIRITAQHEGSMIVLKVIDNGCGIPSAEVHRIWERLYRVEKSRSERGLGLGLSLVKAIVEGHGGTVAVSSVIGKGSCFEVRLPAWTGMAESAR